MKESEAVEIASSFARQQGYDTAAYSVRAVRKGELWELHFRSKDEKPRPGDFFTIQVEDKSGTVRRIVHGK